MRYNKSNIPKGETIGSFISKKKDRGKIGADPAQSGIGAHIFRSKTEDDGKESRCP